MKTIHRVVDIRKINNEAHYYTKGDANKTKDEGYITESRIIGLVKFRIKNREQNRSLFFMLKII